MFREFPEHSLGHIGKFLHFVGHHFHGPGVSYSCSHYPGQVISLSLGRDSATEWLKMVVEALTELQGKMDPSLTDSMALTNIFNHSKLEFLHL